MPVRNYTKLPRFLNALAGGLSLPPDCVPEVCSGKPLQIKNASMLIKASRITNLTDARYFAAKEVDFLGFNLEEGTEDYLDPIYMKAIREWVEGPQIVGEFSASSADVVREYASFFGLDAVQVQASSLSGLSKLEGLTVILETGISDGPVALERLFMEARSFVAYFLVRFPSADALLQDAGFWKKCCDSYPVMLEIDASVEQLQKVLEIVAPAGLSFAGGDEERVGVKSFDEIEAVFELLGR